MEETAVTYSNNSAASGEPQLSLDDMKANAARILVQKVEALASLRREREQLNGRIRKLVEEVTEAERVDRALNRQSAKK